MKAKLYLFEEKMEIRLSDDVLIAPKKNEEKAKFIARVKAIVNDEYLDDEFEIIEIDKDVVALNDDATLKAAIETAEGLQRQLIAVVLADRKQTVKAEKKPKANAVAVEEAKATPAYKEAEANIGKYVSFSPFKSVEVFEGKIAGVALNKTNTILYYTVVEANGKRRCCGVLNESVKFIDAPKTAEKPVEGTVKAAKAKKATQKTKPEDIEVAAEDDLEATGDDDLM